MLRQAPSATLTTTVAPQPLKVPSSVGTLPSATSLPSPSFAALGGTSATPTRVFPFQAGTTGFPSTSSAFRFTRSPSPPPTTCDAMTSPVRVVGMSPFTSARSPRGHVRSGDFRQMEAQLGPQRAMTSIRAVSPPAALTFSPRGAPLYRASSASMPCGQINAVQAVTMPLPDFQRSLVDSAAIDSSEYSPRDSVWKRYFCNQEGRSSPLSRRPVEPHADNPGKLMALQTTTNGHPSTGSTASIASGSSLLVPLDSLQPVLNIASRPEHSSHCDSSRTASPTSGIRSARVSLQQLDRDSQTAGGSVVSSLPSPTNLASAHTLPVVTTAAFAEEMAPTAALCTTVSEEMLKRRTQGQLGSSQASTCGGGTARTEQSLADSWQGNSHRTLQSVGEMGGNGEQSIQVSEVPQGCASTSLVARGSSVELAAVSEWEEPCPRSAQGSSSPSTAPPPSNSVDVVAEISTAPPPMERVGSRVPACSSAVKTASPAQLQQLVRTAEAITADDLHDLRGLSRPHPAVREVVETCLMLLNYRDTRWSAAQAHFAKPEQFLERLRTFDVCRNVSRLQFQKLRRSLDSPQGSFEEGHAESFCVACRGFVLWSRAVYDTLAPLFGDTKRLTSSRQRSRSPEASLRQSSQGTWPTTASTSSGHHDVGHNAGVRASVAGYQQEQQSEEERQHHVRKRPDLGCLQVFPDIYSMSPSELQHVRNLTIRKADVGEVTYPCEIDLIREHAILEDLPNIIRLDPGEVVLYPDSGTKPAEGEGLNRPAIITLFQCMPPNNGNFPDADSKARYREKIAKMTELKGARFVDYDCDRGIWQFRVDHF